MHKTLCALDQECIRHVLALYGICNTLLHSVGCKNIFSVVEYTSVRICCTWFGLVLFHILLSDSAFGEIGGRGAQCFMLRSRPIDLHLQMKMSRIRYFAKCRRARGRVEVDMRQGSGDGIDDQNLRICFFRESFSHRSASCFLFLPRHLIDYHISRWLSRL